MRETATGTRVNHSLLAALDQAARVVEATGAGLIKPEARLRAQDLALALAGSGQVESPPAGQPAVMFVTTLLRDMAVDLAADIPTARRLVAELERAVGLSPAVLGHELLRSSHLSQLPADVALQVQLTLLLIFAGVPSISLWSLSGAHEPRRLGQAGGSPSNSAGAERLVHKLLRAGPHGRWGQETGLRGLAVDRGQLPPAALIAEGAADLAPECDLLLEAVAPVLGATLDRIELLEARGIDAASITAALERRIARLRYDLHDGPQQDVHLLALDLRLFRDQLSRVIQGQPDAGRLLGRLDDLEAQLIALDSELRHIATSMQSPFLPAGTLPEALQAITGAFASRSGIHPEVRLSGDLTGLTDSQQITLLALIREGLNNVQKHSGAERVTITIDAHDRGVDAQLTDDGRGFDPEETLLQAAREGHLGVVGIHERVRMLGGHARVESRPGGPTVISVTLPSWKAGQAPREFRPAAKP